METKRHDAEAGSETEDDCYFLYALFWGYGLHYSVPRGTRREAKGSRIILVIDQRFAESVQYNPNIDELVPVDRRAGGLSASWKLGRQLRDRHPDILFVLHGTTRTFLMGLAMHPKW